MAADNSTTKTNSSSNSGGKGVTNTAFSAFGNLIKLLPTGTVFVFQFLNPVVTNSGECNATNKWISSFVLVACGLSCAISSFTDSYIGSDNQRHYGFVTCKGLWPSSEPEKSKSVDKLGPGDFGRAALSLLVFAVLGLLDTNTVHCFYPGFEATQKSLLQVLPTVIGVFAGGFFMIFPDKRNGIGYPLDSNSDSNHTSNKSDETAPPQNPTENA